MSDQTTTAPGTVPPAPETQPEHVDASHVELAAPLAPVAAPTPVAAPVAAPVAPVAAPVASAPVAQTAPLPRMQPPQSLIAQPRTPAPTPAVVATPTAKGPQPKPQYVSKINPNVKSGQKNPAPPTLTRIEDRRPFIKPKAEKIPGQPASAAHTPGTGGASATPVSSQGSSRVTK